MSLHGFGQTETFDFVKSLVAIAEKFITENGDIKLEIVEAGAYELQKMLLLQEIDIAFLIDPITTPTIQSKTVLEDQVVAIFNNDHPLAKSSDPITYRELAPEQLLILNDSFMIHHQIKKNFKISSVTPNIFFESGAWDLLVSMSENLNMVTILPAPIIPHYAQKTLVSRPLKPHFSWIVKICHLDNIYQSPLVEFVENFFINYFINEN